MNKINIFGMYIGQNIELQDPYSGVFELIGVQHNDSLKVWECILRTSGIREFDIDDCQLILKPISEMSEGDKTIFMKIPIMKKLLPCPDVMFWLIKHGYALDDAWFENGIAIKEKEEIK